MHRTPLLSLGSILVSILIAAPAVADLASSKTAENSSPGVEGRVETGSSPLEKATVYAYELAELSMREVTTGESGSFLFEELPAGIYKLVAFKPGFEPSIVMLSRAAADAYQFVEIQLRAEEASDPREAESFWSVRSEIPPDVLREIELQRLSNESLSSSSLSGRNFRGAVEAVTGYDEPGLRQSALLTGAGIDMEGRIGSLRVGVDGEYLRLAGEDPAVGLVTSEAEATSLALRMHGPGTGHLDLTSVNQRLGTSEDAPTVADFQRYRISWSQPFSKRSRSRFSAQYVTDSQFYRPRWESGRLPEAGARALRLEGVYELEISDRASVETGVRYREHARDTTAVGELGLGVTGTADRALELFGRSGVRLLPKVLVEYGLY
ncbi:MAG: carboxypeptidase-like regulatory domain-containing protein, partial [Thermoanaerobaculia bacterium]|nr:carboxypeptidase-like regulatory domain-containing protein [Thermoanaerobaculia bacterium]